ncbi:MAG: acyltransferase [Hyphomonadaceae bacterium]|nr:acyltransferase [Hyphomonadaceae bacterium]
MLKPVKISEGHDNFFTPLRFIFAFLVLIGHAFVVSTKDMQGEPHIFYHFTFSYLAVNLFFIASGFLVTKSMLYREDVASYSSARFLRIYPGLIVHVLLLMLVFGPLTTNLALGDYFSHKDTWSQPFLVLPFITTDMFLPGILPDNAEHNASAALWTLRYELLAYIGTLAAFLLGLLKHRWMLLAQFVVFAIALPVSVMTGVFEDLPATARSILRFGVCYGLGAAIYGYRDKLNFHLLGIPVLFGISALFHITAVFEVLVMVSLGYTLFWLAYVKIPKLKWMQKLSDVSYGLYIYHWAVLQGVFMAFPSFNPWQLILVSSPIAIGLSILSWKLVEKPSLKLKDRMTKRLKFKPKVMAEI